MEIEEEEKEHIGEKGKNRQHGKFYSEDVQTLEFSKPLPDFKFPSSAHLFFILPPQNAFKNSNYEEKILQRDATKSSEG